MYTPKSEKVWRIHEFPLFNFICLFPLHAASTNSSFLQHQQSPYVLCVPRRSNLMIQSPLHFLFLMHTSVLSFFCSLLSFWFFSCVPFSCMFKKKLFALLYSHGTSSSRLMLVIYKIVKGFFELELNLARLQVRRLQRCLQFALHMSDDVVYLALCLQALRQIARKRDRHFNRREEDNRF
jgi:hypothetical protein